MPLTLTTIDCDSPTFVITLDLDKIVYSVPVAAETEMGYVVIT